MPFVTSLVLFSPVLVVDILLEYLPSEYQLVQIKVMPELSSKGMQNVELAKVRLRLRNCFAINRGASFWWSVAVFGGVSLADANWR